MSSLISRGLLCVYVVVVEVTKGSSAVVLGVSGCVSAQVSVTSPILDTRNSVYAYIYSLFFSFLLCCNMEASFSIPTSLLWVGVAADQVTWTQTKINKKSHVIFTTLNSSSNAMIARPLVPSSKPNPSPLLRRFMPAQMRALL